MQNKKDYEQLYYDLLYETKKIKYENEMLKQELEIIKKFCKCKTTKELIKVLINYFKK